MSGSTPNYGFELIDYDLIPWDTKDNNRWILLDRVLTTLSLAPVRIKGVWANGTTYAVGDNVLDADTLLWYLCTVAHTAATAGSFANERMTNPTYWQVVDQAAGVVRYDLQQTLTDEAKARVRAAIGAAQAVTGGVVAQGGGTSQTNDAINIGGNLGGNGIRAARAGNDQGLIWTDSIAQKLFQDPGYVKFPNGFILQWGQINSSSGTGTVVFPIAFPTFCFPPVCQILTLSTPSATSGFSMTVGSLTLAGFTGYKRAYSSGGGVSIDDQPARYIIGGW